MTIVDLDLVHWEATIQDGIIHVNTLRLDGEQFTLSGLKLASYTEEEEQQLVNMGVLSSRGRVPESI
jgi:hypothetical protein